LHGRLRRLAAKRGQSLNHLCAEVFERAVSSAGVTESRPMAGTGTTLHLLADECIRVFGKDLLGIVFFGSVARSEAFPDSDLDVLLVMDQGTPIRRDLYARWEEALSPFAERSFPRDVSPHFSHLPASPRQAGSLWLEIAIHGIVLWEREGRVSTALRDLRSHIAEGGVTRRVRHGHPYWVRSRSSIEEGGRL
jgi:uncharacterized protein